MMLYTFHLQSLGGVEYFLTCDDGIIKKVGKVKGLFKREVCNPIDFVIEKVLKNV